MAKNEFLPFAIADGANVLTTEEYAKLLSRNSGFSAGVARSKELNTVWRQSSVISHVVAQFISDTMDNDIIDNGDVEALKANFINALSKHVSNTIPAASGTVAGITKLSSAIDSNDETMAATPRAVKAAYDIASKVSIDGIYPVGIVVWFAQNKDPNKLFPGTVWKYIGENKTIRLAAATGADVMTVGGADSVTLAAGNLPAHSHAFSATTSSFDYGTKTTSGFDYGTKSTNNTGAHTHDVGADMKSFYGDASHTSLQPGTGRKSGSAGAHAHTVAIGAHSHTVGMGAHTHTLSGTTANTGSGSAISVINTFIKLMGWYRIS